MLESLRFVQGSIAKKDLVPELMHFHIRNGTIRGYNGALGLCSPIDLDLDVCPKAVSLVKAIQTCKETIQLHMTPNGRLSVKSGKFKAFIDCIEGSFPEVEPEGEEVALNGNMLAILKKLTPFIAEDASRPWARGILFKGQSAFATNNVILVEHWISTKFPVDINIPKSAVTEMIRIGEEPERMQVAENSVTFHFSGNRWLRTQTFPTAWPDLGAILDKGGSPVGVPDGLWDAIESLIPFVDDLGRIYLDNDKVSTGLEDNNGAVVEVPGLVATGCFNYEQLRRLPPVVEKIDFSAFPNPCLFYGDNLRGAIAGMRF